MPCHPSTAYTKSVQCNVCEMLCACNHILPARHPDRGLHRHTAAGALARALVLVARPFAMARALWHATVHRLLLDTSICTCYMPTRHRTVDFTATHAAQGRGGKIRPAAAGGYLNTICWLALFLPHGSLWVVQPCTGPRSPPEVMSVLLGACCYPPPHPYRDGGGGGPVDIHDLIGVFAAHFEHEGRLVAWVRLRRRSTPSSASPLKSAMRYLAAFVAQPTGHLTLA